MRIVANASVLDPGSASGPGMTGEFQIPGTDVDRFSQLEESSIETTHFSHLLFATALTPLPPPA